MKCIVKAVVALAVIVPAPFATASVAQVNLDQVNLDQVNLAQVRPTPTTPPPQGTPGPGSGGVRPDQAQPDPSSVPQIGNSQVDIAYVEPRDPAFAPIRERLMKRRVLEQLQQFLSPLRLPRKLLVKVDQCNGTSARYEPGGPVTICYEYVAQIEKIAPKETPPGSLPRESMIVGAFVQSMLKEVALAVFDILDVPVWGREDDAADKLAGFIMVQFGKEVALKVLIGAAWFFEASDRTWTGTDFASVQAPEAQRFYNYLCIAYGADPNTFKFLLDNNLLPTRRAQRCGAEFFQLRAAFLKTIMPHVDQALLKQVQSANWLMLGEPK